MPRGGHKGDKRPNPFASDEATQSSETNGDGSVTVTQEAENRDGEAISRTVDIADDTSGGVDITYTGTNPEGETRVREVSVDEGADGGVDISVSATNRDGEAVSSIVEIDEDADGFVFSITRTNADGEVKTKEDSMFLSQLLEGVEELSVASVTEALLEHQGIDLDQVDLTTIDDLA